MNVGLSGLPVCFYRGEEFNITFDGSYMVITDVMFL